MQLGRQELLGVWDCRETGTVFPGLFCTFTFQSQHGFLEAKTEEGGGMLRKMHLHCVIREYTGRVKGRNRVSLLNRGLA